MNGIDAVTLRTRLGSEEIALFDVREEGVFAREHLLAASNVPLSRLEILAPKLAPRRSGTIVLVDGDGTLARRASDLLIRNGYTDVSVLTGGIAGWKAAGFGVFSGVYVPSKAFGEAVEAEYGTPHIDAAGLKELFDAKGDVIVLDGRPFNEYSWISIPGAIDCPNGELVLRARESVPSPDTLVVVTCGGRTRSIIGAQTLIDAGLPNKVMSLRNGTQGWHLSGFEVARGQAVVAPLPEAEAFGWARAAAKRLEEKFAIRVIADIDLERFELEAERRTLYRFDVRDGAEYAAGHRKGFLSAPGGQLIQATDTFVAVRNARIVLTDTDGVRARTTASWLVRMGFPNVYVLDASETIVLESGFPDDEILGGVPDVTSIAPDELANLLEHKKTVLIDVASSRDFAAGHIPGAWFVIRSRLEADIAQVPPSDHYVVTSTDGLLARFAARDLIERGLSARALDGGTAGWVKSGRAIEAGLTHSASTADDVWLKAFEKKSGREKAMKEYLAWEIDLTRQIEEDPTIRFRVKDNI